MKNLALEKPEKWEDLASYARMRQSDNPGRNVYDRYYGSNDYPWKKVCRFIASNVGKNWDEVYSKYCKLDWVPQRFKTIDQIGHTVILNTFYRDDEVWYHCKYGNDTEQRMNDVYRESFYVHPKNKILCRQLPKPKNKNQYVNEQAKTMRILGDYHQLLKLNGVWHEVKGEPVKSDIIEVNGLHYQLVQLYRRHTSEDDKTKYTIIDGKSYVPCVHPHWHDNQNKIGPKDRLLEETYKRSPYYWKRKNYDTIKITLCRQLNSKDLKKHSVQNDRKTLGKSCKKCGGVVGEHCHFHTP